MVLRIVQVDFAEAGGEADVVGDDHAWVQALEVDDDDGIDVEFSVRFDDQRNNFQLVLVLNLVLAGAKKKMIRGL